MVSAISTLQLFVVRRFGPWDTLPPKWRPLATALPRRLAERLPGMLGTLDQGWQHGESSFVAQHFVYSSIWPQLVSGERALLRSQGGPVSGRSVPGPSLTATSPSSSPVFSLSPVWPSTRLPWPSPGKLFDGRCAGEAWVRIGVCSGACVPRSWSTSLDKLFFFARLGCDGHSCVGSTAD